MLSKTTNILLYIQLVAIPCKLCHSIKAKEEKKITKQNSLDGSTLENLFI